MTISVQHKSTLLTENGEEKTIGESVLCISKVCSQGERGISKKIELDVGESRLRAGGNPGSGLSLLHPRLSQDH